jgi:hypothetical protein
VDIYYCLQADSTLYGPYEWPVQRVADGVELHQWVKEYNARWWEMRALGPMPGPIIYAEVRAGTWVRARWHDPYYRGPGDHSFRQY